MSLKWVQQGRCWRSWWRYSIYNVIIINIIIQGMVQIKIK